ncbi:hypothetical protein BDV41DRAFT_174768 [Aspergillus transmontanensis]|uniref:Uncharacterized protein n=1 Tax=Aspergillus transmontanensis TaxID=1034304 RepID=A0A5N6WGG6_9EURO|nr:hypothetical protein BDV41DRAFT_174768 [Aspergillus transmontanensis]
MTRPRRHNRTNPLLLQLQLYTPSSTSLLRPVPHLLKPSQTTPKRLSTTHT